MFIFLQTLIGQKFSLSYELFSTFVGKCVTKPNGVPNIQRNNLEHVQMHALQTDSSIQQLLLAEES